MLEWEHIVLIAIGVIIIITVLTVLIRRRFSSKQATEIIAGPARFQAGIAKLHQQSLRRQSDSDGKRRANYLVFRRAISTRPLFSWSDHPTLITDAVEHGWSRFAFTAFTPSPSTKSSLLGLCAAVGGEAEAAISWEIFPGSADFMQKIRLNSAVSVIRSALPLPGPALSDFAFPQEAYFEITILYSEIGEDDRNSKGKEGEKAKLIEEKSKSESVIYVSDIHRVNGVEEGKVETAAFCLGLTTGGSLPLKVPGSYGGSIGFNSDGSIYLDGIKLVSESPEKGSEWAKKGKVVGCGYDPRQKKVFFTVNAELVQVINCKTEEFGCPLYPTMAANRDTIVLVNFGQSAFSYAPANAQRTPNPCFIGPMNSSALGYEDSKELFSMGRIDSQWHMRSATKSSHSNGNQTRDFDDDEADLFEIVLDSKSPNTVL